MATNQTVNELDPTVNLKDTDLIEITVDLGGGTWGSYKMEYGEFKKFGSGIVAETLTFLASGTQTYTPILKEVVAFVAVFDGASVEIIKTVSTEVLLPNSTASWVTLGYVALDAAGTDRRISVTVDKACTVKLLTIKGLA